MSTLRYVPYKRGSRLVPSVFAVFSGFDGTLTNAQPSGRSTRVPRRLEGSLRHLSESLPFGVITSKDFQFIHDRVPYARAWACVGGLDLHFEGGRTLGVEPPFDLENALRLSKSELHKECRYEEKRDGHGRLLGFALDWRGQHAPDKIDYLARRLGMMGCHVAWDPKDQALEAFATKPDTGEALRRLRSSLGVFGPCVYIGDSPADNPAFGEAEYAVGVDHGQETTRLKCDEIMPASELPSFIDALRAKAADATRVRNR